MNCLAFEEEEKNCKRREASSRPFERCTGTKLMPVRLNGTSTTSKKRSGTARRYKRLVASLDVVDTPLLTTKMPPQTNTHTPS